MKGNFHSRYIFMVILFIIYVFMNLIFIYYIGPYAWDDGSITLAYGQTIAHYGSFSLTGASKPVEGSSSIILIFLTALITKLFNFDFYALITWSQINTLVFTLLTLLITYKIIGEHFKNKNHALVITFLVGLFPMYTTEIMNGMEMTMFSVFLLLLVVTYEKKSVWIYVIIPLLLLVRFESIFYLSVTLFALFIFDKNNRSLILKLIFTTLLFFSIFSLLRYTYFGDFMPNTIWAKMHTPYSSPELLGKLFKKILGGIEFLYVFNLMFILMFIFLLTKKKAIVFKDIKFWLVISFFIFAFIAGKNWGYNGRMFLAILPIVVISFILQISSVSSLTEKSKYYIIIFILLISYIINSPLLVKNIQSSLVGGYHQGRYLPNFIYNKLNDKLSGTYSFGITPENYKITGTTVDKVRNILGLETIKFMVPDVGGLGLCCEKINVIDSALLTNQYLAKYGYDKFENLLEIEKPDIIETHGTWSEVTNIYDVKYFKKNYVPLFVNMSFLWLNKKYLISLIRNGNLEEISREKIPNKARYRGISIDENFIEKYTGKFYTMKTTQ